MSVENAEENPNNYIDESVRKNVESISAERCRSWGGCWTNKATVRELPSLPDVYREKTVIASPNDAYRAFKKYTSFFEHVCSTFTETSDSLLLLPCGSTKPIGTSHIHQQMLTAISESRIHPDIAIVSEPCTIIPHNYRLTLPAVNYEFPPEYTEEDIAPEVFDLFTDRLATWFDETTYDTIYTYLFSGHFEKIPDALAKSDSVNRVTRLSFTSVSCDSLSVDSDMFRSQEDITTKIDITTALANHDQNALEPYQDSIIKAYRESENHGEYTV